MNPAKLKIPIAVGSYDETTAENYWNCYVAEKRPVNYWSTIYLIVELSSGAWQFKSVEVNFFFNLGDWWVMKHTDPMTTETGVSRHHWQPIKGPLNHLEHHSTMVSRDLRGPQWVHFSNLGEGKIQLIFRLWLSSDSCEAIGKSSCAVIVPGFY